MSERETYAVELRMTTQASTEDEARETADRSGVVPGMLIGELLLEEVEVYRL